MANNEITIKIDTSKLEQALAGFTAACKQAVDAMNAFHAAYRSLPWYVRFYIRVSSWLSYPLWTPPDGRKKFADGGMVEPKQWFIVGDN